MEKPRIFVSYCHEDVTPALMKGLELWLMKDNTKNFELLIDLNIDIGQSLDEFMELIHSVDGVCIFLGPAYKRKVINRKGGVDTEFNAIVNKYREIKSTRAKRLSKESDILNFELFPILISGEHSTAIPEQIMDLKYADLSSFRINESRGKVEIPKDVESKFRPDRESILQQIKLINIRKSQSYKESSEELYRRLFLNTKSDWINRDGFDVEKNEDPSFVKTIAYSKAEKEEATFFIGRKGSGKSSITEMLWLRKRDAYKIHVNIIADHLNISHQYEAFTNKKIQSDTKTIFSRYKCLELIWELFIYLMCIEGLVSIAEDGKLSQYPRQVNILRELMKQIQGPHYLSDDSEVTYNGILQYSTERLKQFIDHCIEMARDDTAAFAHDMGAEFSSKSFINFSIGPDGKTAFDEIIFYCKRKFLITFDGFDDAFDMFRRDSLQYTHNDELRKRSRFELEWLQALVKLVLKISKPTKKRPVFFRLIHPCITVPKDRFLDLIHALRDSYRIHDTFQFVNWSGIELAILLRKRVEELTGERICKEDKSAEDMLKESLSFEKFRKIPWMIDFDYHGKHYQMPLFMYILRHTFWRPREILMYYAEIINLVEFYIKKGTAVTFPIIKQQIKEKTYGVINSEFINEFKTSLINIEDIMEAFRDSTIRLTYSEINNLIDNVSFEYAFGANDLTLPAKIKYLYQIGFLGVFSTKKMKDILETAADHLFYFSEGYRPLKNMDGKRLSKLEFLIHPVFTEYLGLNTENEDMFCLYDWEYLHKMEARLLTSQFEFDREGMNINREIT